MTLGLNLLMLGHYCEVKPVERKPGAELNWQIEELPEMTSPASDLMDHLNCGQTFILWYAVTPPVSHLG